MKECNTTYQIRVDKNKYTADSKVVTGREILSLAGLDESRHLYQKMTRGERRLIQPDQEVDLSEPGIERFHTIPCEHTEGLQDRRVQFQLSQDDTAFLDSLNLDWECVIENGSKRIVIYKYPLPKGYNHDYVALNMEITSSYPTTQIDMAYFFPPISRADKKPIKALSTNSFDGKTWQRWSRHRTTSNPWRPGIDSVATHIAYINTWFTSELLK